MATTPRCSATPTSPRLSRGSRRGRSSRWRDQRWSCRSGTGPMQGSSTLSSCCSVTTFALRPPWACGTGRSDPHPSASTTPAGSFAKQKWPAVQTWHSALPEEDHSTTWIADRAIDWLRTVEGPFMAWVSFCDPHHPMDPPAPWSGMYTPADVAPLLPKPKPGELEGKPPIHKAWATGFRGTAYESANPGGASLKPEQLAVMIAGYYGMVSMLDANIGRVLEALEARGLSGETMVIMSSDHGDLLGDHRMLFKGPVHYDGLLRVPLIVRGGPYEAAQVVDDPVGLVDLAPTMLDAAGLPVPEWMEGRPLDRLPREHVVTENDHDAAFKLSVRTLTTSRYKLTRYVDREGTGELYDLQEDPGETVNLWEAKGTLKLRSELQAELDGATNRRVRSEPKVSLAG
ncbi:MAG: DUF4976 domain-containing protein [Chloroflexi bacterium]|nr:MAG: DUF4976 domain-containing protein [Chloroflexota bacterium]